MSVSAFELLDIYDVTRFINPCCFRLRDLHAGHRSMLSLITTRIEGSQSRSLDLSRVIGLADLSKQETILMLA